ALRPTDQGVASRTGKVCDSSCETPCTPAGLLAHGSLRSPAFPVLEGRLANRKSLQLFLPNSRRPIGMRGRSPLTVAWAATDLVPDGYTAPCSLLIPSPERGRGTNVGSVLRRRGARGQPRVSSRGSPPSISSSMPGKGWE